MTSSFLSLRRGRPAMEKTDDRKLLNMLGLAMKAGRLVFGTDRVTDCVRSGKKIYLVLISSDASENTRKRLNDCCKYYDTVHKTIPPTGEIIGKAIGKTNDISAVALTDRNFADAAVKLIQ